MFRILSLEVGTTNYFIYVRGILDSPKIIKFLEKVERKPWETGDSFSLDSQGKESSILLPIIINSVLERAYETDEYDMEPELQMNPLGDFSEISVSIMNENEADISLILMNDSVEPVRKTANID